MFAKYDLSRYKNWIRLTLGALVLSLLIYSGIPGRADAQFEECLTDDDVDLISSRINVVGDEQLKVTLSASIPSGCGEIKGALTIVPPNGVEIVHGTQNRTLTFRHRAPQFIEAYLAATEIGEYVVTGKVSIGDGRQTVTTTTAFHVVPPNVEADNIDVPFVVVSQGVVSVSAVERDHSNGDLIVHVVLDNDQLSDDGEFYWEAWSIGRTNVVPVSTGVKYGPSSIQGILRRDIVLPRGLWPSRLVFELPTDTNGGGLLELPSGSLVQLTIPDVYVPPWIGWLDRFDLKIIELGTIRVMITWLTITFVIIFVVFRLSPSRGLVLPGNKLQHEYILEYIESSVSNERRRKWLDTHDNYRDSSGLDQLARDLGQLYTAKMTLRYAKLEGAHGPSGDGGPISALITFVFYSSAIYLVLGLQLFTMTVSLFDYFSAPTELNIAGASLGIVLSSCFFIWHLLARPIRSDQYSVDPSYNRGWELLWLRKFMILIVLAGVSAAILIVSIN